MPAQTLTFGLTGYAGQTVPITVEDDGRIVNTEQITLPANGESATVKVRFTAHANRVNNYVYVDDIRITGLTGMRLNKHCQIRDHLRESHIENSQNRARGLF